MSESCTTGNLALWRAKLTEPVCTEAVAQLHDANNQKIDDAITALQAERQASSGLASIAISGALNGNNREFVLGVSPVLLLLFRNGILQRSGDENDFVLNGAQITTATPPGETDWLFALGN